MPTDIRCEVEPDDRYTVVRLSGTSAHPSPESVRSALLTCLAEQSAPVVVDVTGLAADRAAGAVLAEVAGEVADWPLGRPSFHARPGSGWDGVDPVVPGDAARAYARLGEPPTSRRLGLDLQPVTGAGRRARELVTDGCARWGLSALAGSACIAVTEMVNNVIAHAHTPMSVRIGAHDGQLHVAVRDFSPRRPTYAGPVPPTSWGGRGLLLIDTVSRRWGTSVLERGKVVWAVLHPDDEQPEAF
jgi:hypothetical protein